MLNFDAERFLRIQRGAVAHSEGLRATVARLLEEGAPNLFFVGSGGAGILMQPAHHLLRAASTFPAHLANPAELMANGCPDLGPGSIVVMPSLSGTTAETVAALEYVHGRGAVVIALTGHGDTPLAAGARPRLLTNSQRTANSRSCPTAVAGVALAASRSRGRHPGTRARAASEYHAPRAALSAPRLPSRTGQPSSRALARSDYHRRDRGGHQMARRFIRHCILEEMQWIRTRPVHASDFFHGTLELVEPGVSLLLVMTEDTSRPLCDRVAAFARRYTDDLVVLDPAECELPGLSPRLRSLISPVILATLLERVSAHLEVLRDHPLTTRRYYKRVDY